MRYTDKREMFENLKVGDKYYKGRVVDFDFETIDDDFPRYTDFDESVNDVDQLIDQQYDDFSDCYMVIDEYEVYQSPLGQLKGRKTKTWVNYFGVITPFCMRTNDGVKFVNNNWEIVDQPTISL